MKSSKRITWGLILALGACGGAEADVLGPPPPGASEVRRVVPTDTREVRSAAVSPPAISGGTLLVSNDDQQVFASDPDRDRVSVVDIASGRLLHTIALQPGDEPGRLAQDAGGRVYVALRRGGAVAALDPASGSVLARHSVCGAPRGLAYDPSSELLHVACAGGELVSLSPKTGTIARRVALGTDLRDVLWTGDQLLVTRFKRAELLHVDAAGQAMSARRPATVTAEFSDSGGAQLFDTLEPTTAWRSVVGADGQLLMLHQLARNGEIALTKQASTVESKATIMPTGRTSNPGIGMADVSRSRPKSAGFGGESSSPYGGGAFDCSGVVQTALTRVDLATGEEFSIRIPSALAVDLAVSPRDGMVALAQAGTTDPDQPAVTVEIVATGGGQIGGKAPSGPVIPMTAVQLITRDSGMLDPSQTESNSCVFAFDGVVLPGRDQPTAVAFTKSGTTLIVQSREPARLTLFDPDKREIRSSVPLGGASVYDTGHEIFHRNAGAGLACASCHAEGGDDGHVWVFSTFGQRRTQALHVGLAGTAPFHWQGDMADVSTLMEEVLVDRMGGVHQSPARADALQRWLFELQPPAPVRAATDPAAERGQALFQGQAECSTCHSGAQLTNNRTLDVGTGEPLQVPSLIGIAYRAPFIHNGCAASLHERFDPACGGAAHGKTAELSAAQIDDLVAYLETL